MGIGGKSKQRTQKRQQIVRANIHAFPFVCIGFPVVFHFLARGHQSKRARNSFLTLLEISTTEGWVDVMLQAVDAEFPYMQPIRDNQAVGGVLSLIVFEQI